MSKDDEFMTTHSDGSIRLWQMEEDNAKQLCEFPYFTSPATCVNSSPDDKRLIASSKDHSALIWNRSEMKKIEYSLVGHHDVVV